MSEKSHYLPILVRDGGVTDWERGFCISMLALVNRGGRFSVKQAATLDRIVSEFQRRTMRGDRGVLEDG